MAKNPERARATILDAVDRLLRRGGGGTIDQVAQEVRCAKGLVHYHFKTKAALLAAAAARMGERRRQRWAEAFRAPSPQAAIDRSWALLLSESKDGTARAWISLWAQRDKVTDRAVSLETAHFSHTIAAAASALLRDLGLVATVPDEELGFLLAAAVHGMGVQLEAGAAPARLQGAYAAAWLGALSLARPAAS